MLSIPKTNPKELPHLTTTELRTVDKNMIEIYNISVIRMMECAGLALAQLIRHLVQSQYKNTKNILISAGKGHNGGDGFVAARHLHNWGFEVKVHLANPESELKDAPLEQFNILKNIPVPYSEYKNPQVKSLLDEADIIIDALLGFGITGNPRGNTSSLIEKINNKNKPIIALDVPTGFDSTTGEIYKPCIKANATLTLALPKKGFLNPNSKTYLGDLYLSDIGVPTELYENMGYKIKSIFSKSTILELS